MSRPYEKDTFSTILDTLRPLDRKHPKLLDIIVMHRMENRDIRNALLDQDKIDIPALDKVVKWNDTGQMVRPVEMLLRPDKVTDIGLPQHPTKEFVSALKQLLDAKGQAIDVTKDLEGAKGRSALDFQGSIAVTALTEQRHTPDAVANQLKNVVWDHMEKFHQDTPDALRRIALGMVDHNTSADMQFFAQKLDERVTKGKMTAAERDDLLQACAVESKTNPRPIPPYDVHEGALGFLKTRGIDPDKPSVQPSISGTLANPSFELNGVTSEQRKRLSDPQAVWAALKTIDDDNGYQQYYGPHSQLKRLAQDERVENSAQEHPDVPKNFDVGAGLKQYPSENRGRIAADLINIMDNADAKLTSSATPSRSGRDTSTVDVSLYKGVSDQSNQKEFNKRAAATAETPDVTAPAQATMTTYKQKGMSPSGN